MTHPSTRSAKPLRQLRHPIPGQVYLWVAVLIFGASSAITRKITDIGAQNFIDGENPVSLCNVLFVGNLCALLLLVILHRQQWRWDMLKQRTGKEWRSLVVVAVLSGALAPGLIFQALALTQVTNVVLISRLEPPLTLALSIWLLRHRVNRWEVLGAIAAFVGVALTVLLQPAKAPMMAVGGFHVGLGEVLAALGAIALSVSTIIGKKRLSEVPLGLFGIVRTGLGTVVFFITALILYGPHHFMGVFTPFLWQWMLVYGGIIVVAGQSFWLTGLRATSVPTASIVGSFTPIVGIIAALFILGEIPTRVQYIGGAVILLGVVLGQIGLKRQSAIDRATINVESATTEQTIEARIGFKGI